MLVTGIKSMPQYQPLQLDAGGTHHLVVCQGTGAGAGRQLVAAVTRAGCGDACQVLYVPAGSDNQFALLAEACRATQCCADRAHLLSVLETALAGLPMGLRLYAAGSEEFLASVVRAAEGYGLDPAEIQCERAGPTLRRVYCIHCRTFSEGVHTPQVTCCGCGRDLLVRDHYSRRHAAFMGVMADAETQVAA
ncbi:dimethylamine monooxygenase subunit DmmA family protein [Imbroritus primus]|uniref:dimethylamine monooxygenase subunit DmmA family protein n=1 Tax=Imbroritus primus TaxID=3058603 RepID=UPI003D161D3B